MKKILTLGFLLTYASLYAQQKEDNKYPLSKLTIKWSPVHLFDFYTTFQVALEQRVAKNISLQYDFGPVIPTNLSNSTYNHQRGYKAKLQTRFYIKPCTRLWAFYYGPEVYYNRVNYNKSETYFNNTGNYYQFITYGMQYREKGATIKVGALLHIDRLCFDFQVGVAGRIVTYTSVDEPTAPNFRHIGRPQKLFDFKSDIRPQEKNLQDISPTLSVRIGYIILK